MIKIGIFVEGQTERIFVVKFLEEYLGGEQNFSRIEIENHGKRGTRVLTRRNYPDSVYYILIFDSMGDGNVIPALLDRAENMINNEDYSFLIAIQDMYDRPRNTKQVVINSVNRLYGKTLFPDKLKFVLSIMEIESWFIADYNIFSRINNLLSPEYILNNLHYNIKEINPEDYDHPSTVIDKIFRLIGQRYDKNKSQTHHIVNYIDFDFLYSDEILNKVCSWNHFVNIIIKCLQ